MSDAESRRSEHAATNTEVSLLDEPAAKRARLDDTGKTRASRGKAKKGKGKKGKGKKAGEGSEEELVLRFRNYRPFDENLRAVQVVAEVVPEIKVSAKPVIQGGEELIDLAPKKPTWDLERDIEKKLDLLEKRTQRAVMELLREKIRTEGHDGTIKIAF